MVQNHACHMELLIPCDPAEHGAGGAPAPASRRQATIRGLAGGRSGSSGPSMAPASELGLGAITRANAPGRIVKSKSSILPGLAAPASRLRPPPKSQTGGGAQDAGLTELGRHSSASNGLYSGALCPDTLRLLPRYPETMNKDGSQCACRRPAAVVAPAVHRRSAGHHRASAQAANYMAKPLSTRLSHRGRRASTDVIILDLKRMNPVVEIEYKNQNCRDRALCARHLTCRPRS